MGFSLQLFYWKWFPDIVAYVIDDELKPVVVGQFWDRWMYSPLFSSCKMRMMSSCIMRSQKKSLEGDFLRIKISRCNIWLMATSLVKWNCESSSFPFAAILFDAPVVQQFHCFVKFSLLKASINIVWAYFGWLRENLHINSLPGRITDSPGKKSKGCTIQGAFFAPDHAGQHRIAETKHHFLCLLVSFKMLSSAWFGVCTVLFFHVVSNFLDLVVAKI